MPKRITQLDIARKAGVHNSTVSLALRNSPLIPEATRLRICELAQKMGYLRDPLLQALIAYRSERSQQAHRSRIAYVTGWDSAYGWSRYPHQARLFSGAREKARALGFQLKHVWARGVSVPRQNLSDLLVEGEFSAVILASMRDDDPALSEPDWSRYVGVRLGNAPRAPQYPVVTCDYPGALRLALGRIQSRGDARIGFVVPQDFDRVAKKELLLEFAAESHRAGMHPPIPVLQCRTTGEPPPGGAAQDPHPFETEPVHRWLRAHAPDVVLSAVPGLLEEILGLGLSVPEDLSFVDLYTEPSDSPVTGVRDNAERVGAEAVDLLVRGLQYGQQGVPDLCCTTTVESSWVEGRTFFRREPAIAALG